MRNNVTGLMEVLDPFGYEVTALNETHILNHELNTANYDVLILPDNLPLDTITDHVQEFWLNGGGILAMDGSAAFLAAFGILPPESSGDEGFGVYWDFEDGNISIDVLHPVTKSYEVGYTFAPVLDSLQWDWTTLSGSAIAGDLTVLASNDAIAETAAALAFDPTDRGGKIVTLPIDMVWNQPVEYDPMIGDAVDWLTPRPKGRIVYDLTHYPWYGLDSWDDGNNLTRFPTLYDDMRNALVMRGYTVDKLYPSADGNITADRLEPYDIFIEVLPGINFTAQEVTAITDWISAGGGFIGFGDQTGGFITIGNQNLNYLLSETGLSIYIDSGPGVLNNIITHPTTEGISSVELSAASYVNFTGSAYPILGSGGNDYQVAADELGSGRAILVSDINWIADDHFGDANNEQYIINVANWLSADDANVLLFVNEIYSPNYYRTPAALALNELGVSFYLTRSSSIYLNLSLQLYEWDLVVFDSPWIVGTTHFDVLADYIETGTGRVLMSYYYINNYADHRLWPLFGVEGKGTLTVDTDFYIWNTAHPVFNVPVDYGAAVFEPNLDYGQNGDKLHVFDNATSLGGFTASPDENESVFVLRNDGMTFYNGYLIDALWDDADNSSYTDNFELWLNEISFMLGPFVDSPADMTIEAALSGTELTWTPRSDKPAEFLVQRDGATVEEGPWDGSPITVPLNTLAPGVYEFEVTVWDTDDRYMMDTVIITAEDTTDPTLNSPADVDITAGETASVTWDASDAFPEEFTLRINGTVELTSAWIGDEVTVNIDDLEAGVYEFEITVSDTSGNTATDTVLVTVTAGGLFGLDTTTLIIIVAAAGFVLIILALMFKRGKGGK
jgi:hypothetical protein